MEDRLLDYYIQKQEEALAQRADIGIHYNFSQMRSDTWSRLKAAARALAEVHTPDSFSQIEQLRSSITDFLNKLEPVEQYFAFPGPRLLAKLKRRFERGEYRAFARDVSKVVWALISEQYRDRLASKYSSRSSIGGAVRMAEITTRESVISHRHYFEVLMVDDLNFQESRRLRERMLAMISSEDVFIYDIVVARSFEDALIAILFNHNIQSVIIRHGFPLRSNNRLSGLYQYLTRLNDTEWDKLDIADQGFTLGSMLARMRPELDLFLITDVSVEEVASNTICNFRRIFYRQEDYLELHLSIERGISERYETPFFNALREYSRRPTGVFHAMPISRGNSVFKTHWIQDMAHFYGKNIFLAETSATTGGLDSLLQPTGALKKAQEIAAKAFGARHTFFVTNGTSTANKIVVQALVKPGDIVLVDRDCHKSHHYGLVLSGAEVVYLESYPLSDYSMYGAVPLYEIKRQLLSLKKQGRLDQVKMLLLTNSTFDGIIYHVERVMQEVLAIKPDIIFLWDEAWYAFAGFSPIYRHRTAMATAKHLFEKFHSNEYRQIYKAYQEAVQKAELSDQEILEMQLLPDPDKVRIRVYATQSTHKTLSSLRQGSMIHIWDEDFKRYAENNFHEAYMTHTSTSPNYQILASLDIARRQAEFEGCELVQRSLELAMTIREKVKNHPLLRRYFNVLGPAEMIPEKFRTSGIENYAEGRNGWIRFEKALMTDELVLDPTRITLYTGNTGIDGNTFKNQYLMDQFGIQVNKTSRNSVLFISNIGTTRSGVAFLINVLIKIAQQLEERFYDLTAYERKLHEERVISLTRRCPPLPDFSRFHRRFSQSPDGKSGDLRSAYFMAYDETQCEYLSLNEVITQIKAGREIVSTNFVIPYPPGFPILVPGQVVSLEIVEFLLALDVKEIHGYSPQAGLRVFGKEIINNELETIKPTAITATAGVKTKKNYQPKPQEVITDNQVMADNANGY
jgi:arginine decarboxylase